MANRPKGFGLTGALQRQQDKKYSYEDEQDALDWIAGVVDEGNIFRGVEGKEKTGNALRNGVYLCKLMNKLMPGYLKKINDSDKAFKCMENISNFLAACRAYGLSNTDLFQTSDLFDGTHINAVINTIHAVGRKAQTNGFDGPVLGPCESEKNPRMFSEEQMRSGDCIIGLQMGFNQGANQSGLNFGKTRSILD